MNRLGSCLLGLSLHHCSRYVGVLSPVKVGYNKVKLLVVVFLKSEALQFVAAAMVFGTSLGVLWHVVVRV